MSIKDMLSIAAMNLRRRKLRTFLTVLGMAIGTASIVVMVSLGIGMQEVTKEIFEGYGSLTLINVYNYSYQDPSQTSNSMVWSSGSEVTLDAKKVDEFKRIPGVQAVMPLVQVYGYLKSGQYVSGIQIMGVDAASAEQFGFVLDQGRLPNTSTGSNYELTLGNYVLYNFYNPKTYRQAVDNEGNPRVSLDKSRFQLTFDHRNIYEYEDYGGESTPKGKMYKVNVVGALSQEGGMNAYYTLMDINALNRLYRENKDNMYGLETGKYQEVWVKCESTDDVVAVQEKINSMGYAAYSVQEGLQTQQEMQRQTQMLLGAIGGVALLVAAIGIMNTMMMSIYERTKEIGIIKVLGCRMGNIAGLFLTESAFIGLIGGAVGLGVSYALSYVLNTQIMETAGIRSIIPLYLSLGAVVFSMGVALISGMYPAFRAMRLSALTAIRAE
ncbi:ABC transporter permease [Eubacteriales bacterium OttesenSCG-928-K08]|nr:ABC transporter permease [Eubacteriales bacterium OttesenSCG-928-K08]